MGDWADKEIDEIYSAYRRTVTHWPEILMDTMRINLVLGLRAARKDGAIQALESIADALRDAGLTGTTRTVREAIEALKTGTHQLKEPPNAA